jgi:hypothetical protein
MRLRELAPDLWIADQPLRFFGLELGARMTIIRLAGARLLLHSPIARSPELAEQVERLGSPSFLIAPNRFHHLYAGDWQSAHPSARLYVAPGVEAKRPDLEISGVLGDDALPDWSDVLDQVPIRGFPLSNEVVFFHRPSRTLVASDLAFNVSAGSPALTRIAFWLMGAYGRLSCTPLERMSIQDRAAFRDSLSRILRWPIARIVVAHGEVVEDDAHRALKEAYSWLLRG